MQEASWNTEFANGSDALEGPRLGRVIDAVGSHVLDIVAGDPWASAPVAGCEIYDAHQSGALAPRSIVLGVGLDGEHDVVRVLEAISPSAPAALVVRSGVLLGVPARRAAAASSVVLLALAAGTSWHQLSTSLRFELDRLAPDGGLPASLSGLPVGDLFGLANAICTLIDAPVTIEDRSSRVLAFSDRQDEADPARIATVLGGRLPSSTPAGTRSGGSCAAPPARTGRCSSSRARRRTLEQRCRGSPSPSGRVTRCSASSGQWCASRCRNSART